MNAGVIDQVALTVKAKNAVDAAVACEPRSVDYRKARIQFFLSIPGAGGYERAHKEADALSEFDPYAGLLVHASLHGYQGQGDRALKRFEAAIATRPDDPMGYEWLGEYHLRKGRYGEAIEQFERAVELNANSADTLYALGRAHLKYRQYEEAAEALSQAFRTDPHSTDIAYDLARAHQLQGRTTEAVKHYRQCVSLDDPHGPKAGLARKRLAKLESVDQPESKEGESVQEASLGFFVPVALAYLLACGGWIILARWRVVSWPRGSFPSCDRPWIELGLAGIAAVGIFALGLAYRLHFLLPSGVGWSQHVSWTLNNVIIYSPIFLVLALRKQTLGTVFLSNKEIGRKVAVGAVLGVGSTVVFLGLRGELATVPTVVCGVADPNNATNFLPVFLEGVALAFLFVRVRWVLGVWPAIVIPAVLFAVGHIPRQLAGGETIGTMAAFFFLNTLLPAAILYVVFVSRDIIWIGIVHYVMDIAIKAFE
jgi:tetratricopeptide (TPR) repeat protein